MTDYSKMSDSELIDALRNEGAGARAPADYSKMTDEQLRESLAADAAKAKANADYAGGWGQVKAGLQGLATGAIGDTLSLPQNLYRLINFSHPIDRLMADFSGKQYEPEPPTKTVGEHVTEAIGLPSESDIPEKAKSMYYGSRFFGSSLVPFLGMEAAGAKAAAGGGTGLLRWIGENPGKFAATELSSSLAGAGGTGLANSLYPDSPTARLVGGVSGSLFGPLALTSHVFHKAASSPKVGAMSNRVRSYFQPEQGAAENLSNFIATRGDDPAKITLPATGPATLGTDSQAVHDVAYTLAQKNPLFGRELQQAEQAATKGNIAAIGSGLQGAAKPSGLANAASKFQGALDDIVTKAEAQTKNLTESIAPNSVSNAEALQVKANAILSDAYSKGRAVERAAHRAVNETLPTPNASLRSANELATRGFLEGEGLPAIIRDNIKKFTADGYTPTYGEMSTLRSRAITEAKKAASVGDTDMARRLNIIANGEPGTGGGILADLGAVDNPMAKTANAISLDFNNKFTRAFPGEVMAKETTGARSVRPEQVLEAALSGKPTEGALNLREMQRAAGPEMTQVQEQYIRQLTGRVINPDTGMIDPKKAATLLRNQAPVFEQFPQYRDALQQAVDAAKRTGALRQTAEEAAAPAQSILGNVENPSAVIGDAIKSSNRAPISSLNNLYNVASKTPDGVGGLRATVASHVIGDGDPVGVVERLTKPIRPGQPSLLDWMRGKGMISAAEHSDFKKSADSIAQLAVGRKLAVPGDLEGKVADIADLAARLAGSKVGAKIGSGEGSSLVMAGVGSRELRGRLQNMGMKSQASILEDAMLGRNNRSVDQLLKLANSPRATIVNGQVIKAPPFLFRPSAETAVAGEGLKRFLDISGNASDGKPTKINARLMDWNQKNSESDQTAALMNDPRGRKILERLATLPANDPTAQMLAYRLTFL